MRAVEEEPFSSRVNRLVRRYFDHLGQEIGPEDGVKKVIGNAIRGDTIITTPNVTASLIAWILSDKIAAKCLSPGGLTFDQCVFADFLDLTNIVVPVPLHFQSCTFAAGLSLTGASVPYLELDGSTINIGLAARELRVSTTFSARRLTSGPIDLTDAHLGGGLELSGLTLNSKDTHSVTGGPKKYWTREMEEWVVLALDRITVEGSLYVERLENPSRECFVRSTISLRNAKIRGALVFSGAVIGRADPVYSNGRLVHVPAIRGSGIEVGGAVFLCSRGGGANPFTSRGAVEFPYSNLKDRLIVGCYTEKEPEPTDMPVLEQSAHAQLSVRDGLTHRGSISTAALLLTCAKISGGISIYDTYSEGSVNIENAQIGRTVEIVRTVIGNYDLVNSLDYAVFADGVKIADTIGIYSSIIRGKISLIESQIIERLTLSGTWITPFSRNGGVPSALIARGSTLGAVRIEADSKDQRKNTATGTMDFSICKVRNELVLSGLELQLYDLTSASLLNLSDTAVLDLNDIAVTGSIKLSNIKLCSKIDSPALIGIGMKGAKIGGDLDLRDATVSVRNHVALNLTNARIDRRLLASGVRLSRAVASTLDAESQAKHKAIEASEITVGGTVQFSGEIFGSIDLVGGQFGHDLVVDEGTYGPTPGERDFSQWRHFTFINLARARIAGDFVWGKGATREKCPIGIVSLQAAHINRLHDNPDWWPTGKDGRQKLTGYWRLDGCQYDRLHDEVAELDRVPLLTRQDPERFGLQPFDHLERLLKIAGLSTQSQRIAIARQNARRLRTWVKLRQLPRSSAPNYSSADFEWREARRCDEYWRNLLALIAIPLWTTILAFGVVGFAFFMFSWVSGESEKNSYLPDFPPHSPALFIFLSVTLSAGSIVLIFARKLIGMCPLCRCFLEPTPPIVPPPGANWNSLGCLPFLEALGRVGWHYLLEGFSGYGHRLRRLALASCAWVLFAGTIFNCLDHRSYFIPSQAAALVGYETGGTRSHVDWTAISTPIRHPSHDRLGDYPKFNPYLYAIDLYVPFLEIHQDAYWYLSGKTPWYWKAIKLAHIIFGWIALFLVAASPFQVFRRE